MDSDATFLSSPEPAYNEGCDTALLPSAVPATVGRLCWSMRRMLQVAALSALACLVSASRSRSRLYLVRRFWNHTFTWPTEKEPYIHLANREGTIPSPGEHRRNHTFTWPTERWTIPSPGQQRSGQIQR